MKRLKFLTLLLSLLAIEPCHGDEARSKESEYRYVVSWDAWDESSEDRRDVSVRLNGVVIGKTLEAFEKLAALPLERGDRIKLILTPRKEGGIDRQVFWTSDFIYRWIERGATLDFFEHDQKLKSTILTWTKVFGVDGNFVPTMDDVVWIVDGQEIGKGPELRDVVDRWMTDGGMTIIDLTPLHSRSPQAPPPSATGTAYERLRDLARARKIRVLPVRPWTESDLWFK